MRDRFVKVEDRKIVLIGAHVLPRTEQAKAKCEAELISVQTKINKLKADKKIVGDNLTAEKDELESQILVHSEKIAWLHTFTTIAVADDEFGISSQHDWWKIKDGAPKKPTASEKQAYVDAKIAEQNNSLIETLYDSAVAYQALNIDANTKAELDKAESLFEAGKVTPDQLPKNKELADWLESILWNTPLDASKGNGSYYARKNNIKAGKASETSADFSDIGPAPWGYADIRIERKTFLASL